MDGTEVALQEASAAEFVEKSVRMNGEKENVIGESKTQTLFEPYGIDTLFVVLCRPD